MINKNPTFSFPIDHELRFQSLVDARLSHAFPCDAAGHVDIDALSESARKNYFYARTVVGREYLAPAIITTAAR